MPESRLDDAHSGAGVAWVLSAVGAVALTLIMVSLWFGASGTSAAIDAVIKPKVEKSAAVRYARDSTRGTIVGADVSPMPMPTPSAPPPIPTPTPTSAPTPAPTPTPSVSPEAMSSASPRLAAGAEVCTASGGKAAKVLARKISDRLIAAYNIDRANWVGFSAHDRETGIRCGIDQHRMTEVASVDKVMIVSSLLYKNQVEHTKMTPADRKAAEAAITQSNNDAATQLWRRLGATSGASNFLDAAGVNGIALTTDGSWGWTRASASGEAELMRAITSSDGPLSKESRDYILGLMRRVEGDQRWGISKGASSARTISIKNGWGPFPVGGWHVNSIGNIVGGGHDVDIAIMSDGNSEMEQGVQTVERLAEAFNQAL